MNGQRLMQFVFNWLQVNHYLQFEPEQWTTGRDAKKVHPGRYNVNRRDPFYMSNTEIPTKTLKLLQLGIAEELKRRAPNGKTRV